jgi:hypothetical protein
MGQKSKASTSLQNKNPKNYIRSCVLEIYIKFIFINEQETHITAVPITFKYFFMDVVYSTVLSQFQCFWLKRSTSTITLLGKTPISQHNDRDTQVICKVELSKQAMLARW